MASEMTSTANAAVSWNQKFTDFDIVVKSGEKLRVHKLVLALNSEVFEDVLTKMKEENGERKKPEINLEHFDRETVIHFLQYIYAGRVDNPKTIQQIKLSLGPNEYVYKRSFDQNKLTPELLKMAGMYGVEDLKTDCTQHLKQNISDENVMEVLTVSHTLEIRTLALAACQHLVDSPNLKTLQEVPGFSEAPQSPLPLKELMEVVKGKIAELVKGSEELQRKVSDLEKQIKDFKATAPIEVTVHFKRLSASSEVFLVRAHEKISTLLEMITEPLEPGQVWRLYGDFSCNRQLDNNTTLADTGIEIPLKISGRCCYIYARARDRYQI